jgi:cell wall-associated NlpC family hydrolase
MRSAQHRRRQILSSTSDLTSVIGRAALAPVLADPTVRAEQVTQLVLGETASILEHTGEWRRVRIQGDGYEGWINRGYLSEGAEKVAAEWRARATGWSMGAVLRVDAAITALPLRARVVLEGGAVILPDNQRAQLVGGSIPEISETRREACSVSPEVWALAHFAGSPYLWGGVSPWGVDCSGLVQTTFLARGVALPRDSSKQASVGQSVSPDAARAGDLLFFRSESGNSITHVAFAGEGETLVHSTLSCGGVLVEPWGPGTRAASLRERLVVVRRLEGR